MRLMLARRVILTICQIRPRTRCGRPSSMSPEPMLTTLRPMALAALMARLRFSVMWNLLRGLRLTTRASMASASARLISRHRRTPSATTLKSSLISRMGSK